MKTLPLLIASVAILRTAFTEPDPGKAGLPQGPGLAALHPGDNGIAAHPEVIFADDFETGDLGDRWDDIRNEGNKVLSFADPGPGTPLGKRCLRATSTLGHDTGGGFTKWFPSADTIHIRFYTRFAADCDYIHHFVTLRANKGLTGKDKWSGFGGAGTKPRGDERFSTAIEPWGDSGKIPPPGRWNFYSYWPDMEKSGDGKYWGNSFYVPGSPPIPRDRWICVEFMLRHNTPGKADGSQAYWIDGRLQGRWEGIAWRRNPTLTANALTLETYVTDRWTKRQINVVDFDNVVIARAYIGPSPPAERP